MPTSMLGDFAVRLACGLSGMLLITSWQVVPLNFFRTITQVILGLLVLAVLDLGRHGPGAVPLVLGAAAGLSFIGSILWGLGLPRVASPISGVLMLATAGVLFPVSQAGSIELQALNAIARLSSAFLMGATLSAMLLGHQYLTAPAMSIAPLERYVRCMAWALALRIMVAAAGCWMLKNSSPGTGTASLVLPSHFFLGIRWGIGFGATALATFLTWKTVVIRSTQSATGILYIAMTFVLFGELTALVLARSTGVPL